MEGWQNIKGLFEILLLSRFIISAERLITGIMADPVEGSTPAPTAPKAGATTAAPPPAAKPAAKPTAKSKAESADPPDPMRRRVIWGMIYGYLGINLLMFLRFFFPRALYEPNTIFNIGYPADFSLCIVLCYLLSYLVWIIRTHD